MYIILKSLEYKNNLNIEQTFKLFIIIGYSLYVQKILHIEIIKQIKFSLTKNLINYNTFYHHMQKCIISLNFLLHYCFIILYYININI